MQESCLGVSGSLVQESLEVSKNLQKTLGILSLVLSRSLRGRFYYYSFSSGPSQSTLETSLREQSRTSLSQSRIGSKSKSSELENQESLEVTRNLQETLGILPRSLIQESVEVSRSLQETLGIFSWSLFQKSCLGVPRSLNKSCLRVLSISLVWELCLGVLSGSLVQESCLGVLSRGLVQESCLGALSRGLVQESCFSIRAIYQDPSKTWTKNMVFEKFPVVGGWWVFLVLYRVSQKKSS